MGNALKAEIEIRKFLFEPMANGINPLAKLAVEMFIREIGQEEGFPLFNDKVDGLDFPNLREFFSSPAVQGLKLLSYGLLGKSRFDR
jgi:hypothetical protein